MIEDPREVERRRLLGIEDPDAPTRDDLAAALEEVSPFSINPFFCFYFLVCVFLVIITWAYFKFCFEPISLFRGGHY